MNDYVHVMVMGDGGDDGGGGGGGDGEPLNWMNS
jgi:hypothetical protein